MELIAGDIGGTKTTLALFRSEGSLKEPVAEATYASGAYSTLEDVIHTFFNEYGIKKTAYAVFGLAGPVVEGKAAITNLPWVIEESRLASMLEFTYVHLLNDLEAMGYGIPLLDESDLSMLNEGTPAQTGPKAVIAPGTGLGETYLTWDGSHYVPHASEGGHTEFGPSDEKEIELLKYLLNRFDHVSYELVCSGSGIPNLYAFLKDKKYYPEPEWFSDKLSEGKDPTALIINNALDANASCDICKGTLKMFVSILGAEAGNLALKILATGGVYIGGGIPPRILHTLKKGRFMKSFLRKGRLSKVLHPMPVYVILNPRAGLIGAAAAGFEAVGTLP